MSKLYKVQHLPPEGPILILDNEKSLEHGGKTILESLDIRIKRAQTELLWLQKEIEQVRQEKRAIEKEFFKSSKETQLQAKDILKMAEIKANEIIEKAKTGIKKDKEDAYNEAQKKGYEQGFSLGNEAGKAAGTEECKKELERLIAETKQQTSKLIDNIQLEGKKLLIESENILLEAKGKKTEIIDQAKIMLIDTCLLIAKKVIKVECERNKDIILNNLNEALKKVKGQEEITIKVNFSDLETLELHKKNFLNSIPKLKGIRFEDDETVEPGGCKIETNFGFIDAQIRTQIETVEKALIGN